MGKLKEKSSNLRILLFDIENSPLLLWAWGIHDDPSHSTKFVKKDWYVMCWSAKWLGEKDMYSAALPDYEYDKNNPCDKAILENLWNLLDEADIVIAHNGKKFDCKKANARFLIHGMLPPSPYRVIDTLTVARSVFKFSSNRLGDLGQYLGVGNKIDTGGFDLWKKCMEGHMPSWEKMIRYCKQDVKLLEKVYLKLRPYITNHPKVNPLRERPCCTSCGCESVQYHGYAFTNHKRYKRYQCNKCGTWGRDTKNA